MAEVRKKQKKKDGRPLAVTPDVVRKLEKAFTVGANVTQACDFAGISRETYYKHCERNAGFTDKVAEWSARTGLRAKYNIHKAIEAEDVDVSKWYLERTDDAFNPKKRAEITGTDGGAVQIEFGWASDE